MGKKQLRLIIAGLIILNCLTIVFFLFKLNSVNRELHNDEVVATVGKQSITRQKWLNELEARYGKEVLKDLINREVIQVMAKKNNINISKQEIDREFLLLQANQSFESKSASDEKQWKEQIRNSLILEELLTKDVIISEKELKGYYDKHKDLFNIPEVYHLSHIVVKTKKEAEDAYKELSQGSSFSALAMERSIDEFSANEGGDIGFLTERDKRYPDQYVEIAKKLKNRTYSKPFKTEDGYILLWLEKKIKGKNYSFKEVRSQIRRQMALEQMKTSASVETLWEEAKVEWFYGKTK
ncbi:peptidyl-prolyl cis-trans isomerase [Neobacillus sp.]|uniref:peptidyl-prolyl cis-trans isomerase n=1 Tax=Neobacillus sp. TaxID=2675273 RepID=UPI0035B519BF